MKTFVTFFLLTVKIISQSIPFPLDTIVANDKFNNRQTMLFDREGKIRLVYSSSVGSSSDTREIYYVQEGTDGQFITQQLTNNLNDENYPTISMDSAGNVHVGMIGKDPAGGIYQVKYTGNSSGSFTTPVYITTGGINKATPASMVGPDGKVHFVYYTYVTGADNVYYRWYDPADSSLSPELLLTAGEASGDVDAQIVFDSQGFMHLVFKAGTVSTGILKYYNNVSGTITEYATGVTANIANPKLVIDSKDKIHIIFRNETSRTLQYINNVSGAFSTPVSFTPAGQLPAGYANFAKDDNDNFFFVWQSSQSASGKGFFLKYLKDGVFSDTMNVFYAGSPYVTRNTSVVAAKGNGEIAITFSPAAVINSVVLCDILLKRGKLFKEPNIVVDDSVMDFGSVPVFGLSQFDLMIRNTGDSTLQLKSYNWNSTDFSIRLDYPETIAPGDSDIAVFVFMPLTGGLKLDTLVLKSNDPQDSVIRIPMRGRALAPQQIVVSKDSLNLEYTTSSQWIDTFYVKNVGDDTLTVDSLTITGNLEFFSYIEPMNATIPGGDSVMFYIELMIPVTMSPPIYTDTLRIWSNDTAHPKVELIVRWEEPQSVEYEGIPLEFGLEQNFPNPFNPETRIKFSIKSEEFVTLDIYNTTGELLTTLVNATMLPGKYSISFDASSLPSGVYLYRIIAGSFTQTRKMLLLK